MSILSVLQEVTSYNKDKPYILDEKAQRSLTDKDHKKINKITKDITELKLPYAVQLVIREPSKQLYLRCKYFNELPPQVQQGLPSFPDIHAKINKV